MSVDPGFVDHVRDLLSGLGPVSFKRMFGAMGVYADDLFFAIIDDDVVFLKTDEATRAEFEAAGSTPFQFTKKTTGELIVTGYLSLPDSALDDPDEARRWARLAIEAAMRKGATKPKRKRGVSA